MRPASIGRWLALWRLVVLVLSLTPTGEVLDPHEAWWRARWQWMQRALRQDQAAPAVTVNPILLYLGLLLSVGGLAVAWRRDCGASPTGAGKPRGRQEDRSRRIFIGGLAYTTTREEVRELFEAYGEVEHVHLITERETGRSRGFGFVEMPDATAAQAAIDGLNGTRLGGRTINVSEARQREARGGPQHPRQEQRPRW